MSRFITFLKCNAYSTIIRACKYLYLLSLCLPGIIETRGTEFGFLVLLIGWLGPLDGIYAWYANPLLLLSLIFHKKNVELSQIFSLFGLIIGVTALFVKTIPYDDGSAKILHFGLGYYLWLFCFILAFAATIIKDAKPSSEFSQIIK